jgi:aminoglycoside/choline kinase family phosphotransferase
MALVTDAVSNQLMDQGSERLALLRAWVSELLGSSRFSLSAVSSDASFRRYWRLDHAGESWVLMDAPPHLEDCGRFADLSHRLRAIGLSTPQVFAEDRQRGFLMLSDFGDRLYLSALSDANVDRLYGDALDALATLQARGPVEGLPAYDEAFLRRELALFDDWFLVSILGDALAAEVSDTLASSYDRLVASALEQPRVCVHRDYHSRNLMVLERGNPGILDFQDAVLGPVTYDLVSLLRDCYVAWPRERVLDWASGYFRLARRKGVIQEDDLEGFLLWFDRMGVQRHLKAVGIFARLDRRDGRRQYLADIPRTLGYVAAVSEKDLELAGLSRVLGEAVMPRLEPWLAARAAAPGSSDR